MSKFFLYIHKTLFINFIFLFLNIKIKYIFNYIYLKWKKNSILILLVITITLSLFLHLDKIDSNWTQKYPFQWYDQGIFDILDIKNWENIEILDKYHRISLTQLPTKIHNNYTHEKTPIGSIELQGKLWINIMNT